MKLTRTYKISIGIILLLTLVMVSLFEIKDVPDVQWNSKYNYESKEANDTWLFHELLTQKYESVTIFDEIEDLDNIDIDSSLIIYMGKSINPYKEDLDSLNAKTYRGANVLFIGESIQLNSDLYDIYNDNRINSDTVSFNINENPIGIKIHTGNQFSAFGIRIQQHHLNSSYTYKINDIIECEYDEYILEHDSTIMKKDTMFICYEYRAGQFCLHYVPFAFSNIASQQSFYRDHFNRIFSNIKAQHVYLKRSTFSVQQSNSILKYIFAQRAFKWSYYLLILTTLIYLIFASKRKQKSIPLVNKKENSSIEFIESVSRIIQNQKRNDRLIIKMKNNFHAFVENHYFLYQNDEQYQQKMIKKTKINEELIDSIFNTFEKYKTYNQILDKDVSKLYMLLNEFYKKSEK